MMPIEQEDFTEHNIGISEEIRAALGDRTKTHGSPYSGNSTKWEKI